LPAVGVEEYDGLGSVDDDDEEEEA
jgi:hypothetical protein